jgi:hypothetical protein
MEFFISSGLHCSFKEILVTPHQLGGKKKKYQK